MWPFKKKSIKQKIKEWKAEIKAINEVGSAIGLVSEYDVNRLKFLIQKLEENDCTVNLKVKGEK